MQVSAWLSSLEWHSVWLVVAVRAPILVVHMAATAHGAVIHQRAANQQIGTSPLCPSSKNSQFLCRSRALLVQLDFCLFALFIWASLSLLYMYEVGSVLSVSPFCEAKAEIKAGLECFDNSIFNFFPPPLGVRPCFALGWCPLLAILIFKPFFWASFRAWYSSQV